MPESTKRNRRRQLLSNPRVQLRIILLFAIMAALYVGTGYWISARLMGAMERELAGVSMSREARGDVSTVLDQQGRMLDLQLKLYTFLNVFVLLVGGAVFSHRIGGPIYHLTTYMAAVAAGATKPREIRFRQFDFFHDLAAGFNAFQRSQGLLPPSGAGAPPAPGNTGATPGDHARG